MPTTNDFTIPAMLDLTQTIAAPLFDGHVYPWEVLPHISRFITELGAALDENDYERIGGDVWIAKSATVAGSASITGPCIICAGADIRHCAFIRGSAIVGAGAVVGNSTELKNAILFGRVQAPHYNYVGDSILGAGAHLGAGSITSNLKTTKTPVDVHIGAEIIATGLKKFGAILGDRVEVGCNSVFNPGVVVGRDTDIYPLSMVRGAVPAHSIYKSGGVIVEKV